MILESAEILIKLMEDRRKAKVRYGRARLTVARWGSLDEGPVWDALADHADGKISAEDACWAFVRARIISHTPSFTWDDADLGRLLELVTGASREPEIPSLPPKEMAAALMSLAEDERRLREETRATLLKSTEPIRRQVAQTMRGVSVFAKYGGSFNPLGPFAKSVDLRSRPGVVKPFAHMSESITQSPTLSAMHAYTKGSVARSWSPPSGLGRMYLHREPPGLFGLAEKASYAIGAETKAMLSEIAGHKVRLPPGILADYRPMQEAAALVREIGCPGGNSRLFSDLRSVNRRWVERFKQALPRNWRELDRDQVDQIGVLMERTGLGLAWAPRREIIAELLEANGYEQRCTILECRAAEIFEDVEEVLDEVQDEDLTETVAACREAIATYIGGHPGPAQAYLTPAFTGIVHGIFGADHFGPVKERFFSLDPQEVDYREATYVIVGKAWVTAQFKIDDAREGYNRNVAAHHLGPHYSPANCIGGILLLSGLLRELDGDLERDLRSAGSAELLAA